jgi:hypothetical protein
VLEEAVYVVAVRVVLIRGVLLQDPNTRIEGRQNILQRRPSANQGRGLTHNRPVYDSVNDAMDSQV